MENTQKLDDLDIFYIEQQLREKMYELQQKTDTLEQTQKELLEMRHILYDAKSNLESNSKINNELKMQLFAATTMINRLEDEKRRTYIEQMQFKANYEGMFNEHNSLIEQIKVTKSELIQTNEKLQIAEDKIYALEMLNKSLEESLTMLKNNTLPMIVSAESEIAKLKKEYHHLQDSCQMAVDVNKRLQTVGLCAHTVYQKNKIQMKELQCQLTSLSINGLKSFNCNTTMHPEIQQIYQKLQAILKELNLSSQKL